MDRNDEEIIKLIEVKEKLPIKTKGKSKTILGQEDWTYGWDTRRLLWYIHLENMTKFQIIYTIRQINDRFERKFIQWDSILLEDFLKSVGWSTEVGGGGSSGTMQVPYKHFQDLSKILVQ